jgi:hypothetical protein
MKRLGQVTHSQVRDTRAQRIMANGIIIIPTLSFRQDGSGEYKKLENVSLE